MGQRIKVMFLTFVNNIFKLIIQINKYVIQYLNRVYNSIVKRNKIVIVNACKLYY